ncbi:tRNA-dependent cyclodipeptide synthase [Streptomyces sp. CB02923]|uniref:tRNA-dependent cyclodipeptide synthase n=1 Tax=Streptomyces sp. CB02923 TaxID=1718985 RepID=UPI00095EE2D3|nr:tRNA-dependent cyclodipeptide synthase [Streptomyces sp. CB02923]OKI06048.1 tRNA-dependent cyclodipeptide synthase [Streptomyces sp. CB02923]
MSEYIIDGRTKANFEEAAKKLRLADTKAILLVSVGQRYHEGDKLRATVELLNRSEFKQVTIAVADTLQRSNLHGLSPEEAYTRSLREGGDWLERNAKMLGRLSVPNEVLRWDEALTDPDYAGFRQRIEHAYENNPLYRQAVNATIGKFINRFTPRNPEADTEKAFRGCLEYLIEECPIIMPMWAHQGYDYVIYPQMMTAAMAETQRLFVAEEYPGKGGWLSLRFKKRAAAAEQAA